MKKTVVPASFLSVVLPSSPNQVHTENQTYLIRETKKNSVSTASLLYQILFGKTIAQQMEEAKDTPSEPDYFSSYE